MASSPQTADHHKLKMLRIRCKELGITAEDEEALDFLSSAKIPLAICFAMQCRKIAERKLETAELELKIAEKKVKIAELKNAELKSVDLVAASMESTYGNTKDNFKQPPIQLNTGVKPSVGGNARKYRIKNSKGDTKVITMKIPKVKIEPDCEEMWVDVNDVMIPVATSDGRWHCSIIGSQLNPSSRLITYANEFQVQRHCEVMIRDALRSLGLLNQANTHMEFSMYLMKPDIIIVVRYQGRVFFAVQVKSPEVGEEKVFGNNTVAGQMWSYLYGMKASGNPCPIGAIMTYNKISIVTLRDYTKNEQGKDDAEHKTRIKTAQQRLSSGRTPQRELQQEVKEKCEAKKNSPIKPRKDFNKTNHQDNEELQQELWEEEVERNAFCSRVHEKGEVFPCLVQAIEIAYRAICDADAKQVVCIERNAPIGQRLVFKLGEDSFDWVKIGGNVLAKIDGNIPDKRTKYLYNLGKLRDEGITSVYLACSISGKVCTLKDYSLGQSSASHDNEQDDEENAECELLIENAEMEERRWTEIYGGRYQARAQCFGGKHCLLMPYGHQVATEPDDRWQHVSGIRKELELFAQCTKGVKGRPGYKYEYYSDLQWCHVLLDTEKNIFLCNLESLEEIDNTESRDELVYKPLASLLEPMRNEKEELETLEWLLRSKTADVVAFICSIGTLKDFFEGSSQGGDTEVTEQCGEILESLFPSTATFEGLSANPKAVVTMCMISHYRNGQSAKQQCEASQSDTSIPGLEESQKTEEGLGSGENPEDANKGSKRVKII